MTDNRDLPMEPHHLLAEEAIRKRKGRIGHSFKSAFRHIRQAWKLYPIDPEMSLFRAITGEEEAASGLMLALMQQRYPGANRLKPRDHRHKAAVAPFLTAVNNMLVASSVPAPKLSLSSGKTPALEVSLDLQAMGLSEDPKFATPDHPFNFAVKKSGRSDVYLFQKELDEVAASKGVSDIQAAIAARANLRNELLYASDDGVPEARFGEDLLLEYRSRIYALCLLTIGILQTKQHQIFAAQTLEAFLTALGHAIDDRFDYSVSQPAGPVTMVIQQADRSHHMTTGYRGYTKLAASPYYVWRVEVVLH